MIPDSASAELVLATAVLALARPAALMLVVPLFGPRLSAFIRIAIAIPVALIGYPLVLQQLASTNTPFFVVGVHELLIGIALGLAIAILLAVGQFAGGLLDEVMPGWRASSILPGTPGPASATLVLATLVVFALMDGHALVFEALIRSWQLWPAASQTGNPSIALGLLNDTVGIFAVAVAASAPLLIALAMAEVILGITVRFAGWPNQSLPLLPVLAILFLLLGCYVLSSKLTSWLLESLTQLVSF